MVAIRDHPFAQKTEAVVVVDDISLYSGGYSSSDCQSRNEETDLCFVTPVRRNPALLIERLESSKKSLGRKKRQKALNEASFAKLVEDCEEDPRLHVKSSRSAFTPLFESPLNMMVWYHFTNLTEESQAEYLKRPSRAQLPAAPKRELNDARYIHPAAICKRQSALPLQRNPVAEVLPLKIGKSDIDLSCVNVPRLLQVCSGRSDELSKLVDRPLHEFDGDTAFLSCSAATTSIEDGETFATDKINADPFSIAETDHARHISRADMDFIKNIAMKKDEPVMQHVDNPVKKFSLLNFITEHSKQRSREHVASTTNVLNPTDELEPSNVLDSSSSSFEHISDSDQDVEDGFVVIDEM